MIQDLPVDRFLDEPYGRGLHVVLLHLNDDLYIDARDYMKVVVPRLHGGNINLWTCHVRSAEDVAMIQACRFPQYRFILNGVEKLSHVGVLDDRGFLDKVFSIEDV